MRKNPQSRRLTKHLAAALALPLLAASMPAAQAQTAVTFDGTSGSNSISSNYTTTGGLTLGMGFFAEYLIIGGGGGGAGNKGGGGGGGGFASGNFQVTSTTNAVTVGSGGAAGSSLGNGGNGGSSSVFSVTAAGGNGGTAGSWTGGSSGNGLAGGAGTGGTHYTGGGGGGSLSAGSNATSSAGGAGGAGQTSSITGTSSAYGGGGGGGSITGNGSLGGAGGGGNGASSGFSGFAGTANTGGGGGGGGDSKTGGAGGSGVVMIRYAGNSTGVTGGSAVAGNGSASGYTIQRFTSSGTFGVDLNSRLGATLDGTISGASGTFTYNGPGTLTLAADNTYAGGTVISGGTLRVGNGGTTGSLGAGAVTNNATLAFNRSDSIAVGNAISGTGSLTKSAANTLTLTANNTYTGTTTISGGTLQVGNGGTNGTLGSGSVTNNGTLAFNRSNTNTVGTAISGTGSVIQQGSGVVEFTSASTYTGGLTVSSGEAWGRTAGAFGAGSVTLGDASSEASNISLVNSFSGASSSVTINNTINVNTNGTGTVTIGGRNTSDQAFNVFSGAISLGRDVNLEAGNTASRTTFTGAMSGNGGVTVTQGRVTYEGTKTYTGGTTVNSEAILQLSGNELLLDSSAVTVNGSLYFASGGGNETIGGLRGNGTVQAHPGVPGNYRLAVSNSDTSTFGGTIINGGGTVALTKAGSGTQILSGNNTYSGSTTISGGTLQIGAGGATGTLGTGAVTNNAALVFDRSNAMTVSNAISGNGSVTKKGAGTLTISGSNTNTGGTTINAGTLALASSNLLADTGTVTINSGGTFNLGSNGDYIGTLVMNGNATVAGSSGAGGGQFILTQGLSGSASLKTLTATGANNTIQTNIGISSQFGGVGGNANLRFDVVGASDSLTVGGVIADKSFDGGGTATSGAISKLGAGTLILDGNNTFSGGVTLASGTIQVGTGGTKGNITGNDAAISNNGTLVINRADGFGLGNAISGTGSLIQAGAGTTTVSGSNTYTGGTTISGGTLRLASANRLADTGAVTVSGGSFNLGGFSNTVGAVTLTSGAIANGTLTGSSYNLQAGSVSAVLAGSGDLTKNGSGTVTLSGANTHTGFTTINGGTLATSGNNRLATGNAVTVNSGGTFALGGNQTLASVAGGGTIQLGDYTLSTGASSSSFNGTMAGNGGLTKSGAGTFTLSGQTSFTGDTNITGGTLVLANANALSSDAVVLMQAGTTLTVNQRTFIGALDQGGGTVNGPGELVSTLTLTSNGSLNAVLADGPDYAAGILKRTSGTTTIGAANTFTGAVKIQGGTLQLSGNGSFAAGSSLVMSTGATMDLNNKSQTFSAMSGSGGTIAMGSGSLTVNNSSTDDYNGVITGSGALTKQGAGTITLSGNNTYSGGTTVSGGKLGGTTTSLKGAITNNAQVEFAQDSDGSYSGNMGGSGALIKSGTGAITLSGSNTHSGGTTISGGKLIASTASLQGNIANNAEFELAQSTSGTYAGNISGSGSFTKSGSGTVTLSGSNTYSGGTTVSGGELAGTTANLQGNIANNAAVEFNQASSDTYLGAMEGTGSLTKSGAGNLVMSGTSTYSGATTVSAGQLTVNGAIASTATVQSGASIGGSGRVGGLILNSGSTLTPGNSPGTLTVNGDATWNSGANYNWQVYATNTNAAVQTGAGTGWDFFDVSGTLTLSGLDATPFNLNLWSLSSTAPDVNGTIPGWNPNVGSTWLIASAGGGINLNGSSLLANTNYSSLFNINTAATNGTGGWSGSLPSNFQVLTLGDTNNLYLYAAPGSAAVPEPGQVAASLLLLAGIGGYVWLKRRKAAKAT